MPEKTRIIPVSEWDEHHTWPTEGALRVHICNAEKRQRTGEGPGDPEWLTCVIRYAGRLLIDEEKFFQLMRRHSAAGEKISDPDHTSQGNDDLLPGANAQPPAESNPDDIAPASNAGKGNRRRALRNGPEGSPTYVRRAGYE